MKAASIKDIKDELTSLPPAQVLALCLRLARFKKENKDLLSYLLFDAQNQAGYIESITIEMTEAFDAIEVTNYYLAKKSLRKILRCLSRYSKHMADKQAEAELLIHFCLLVKQKNIPLHKTQALSNLYKQQVKKIHQLISGLHEDLAFDYKKKVEGL